MHIVYVNQYGFTYLGGVEHHILSLGCELRKQGDQVTLLCREHREARGSSLQPDGFRVVRVSGLREMLAFFRHEAVNIDVCHAHMARKPFALIGLLLARRFKIPTVFTPHCFYPSSDVYMRFVKKLYDSTFTRLTFSCSDRVINLTPQDRQDSLARGMSAAQSTVIPNSILYARLLEAPLVSFREKYGVRGNYLLHVGRFAKQKCIDFLVRNHARSEAEDLSLVLIGQDDGEMQRLAQLVDAAGLSGRVHIIERIDHGELCAAYREASALVMASQNEGLPTVILEAAIFGTPVIAPRVGGIPYIVEEGTNGFLYEWGDSTGYIDRVRRVITGKLRVQEVSKSRVMERYSWEVNAGRVKSLYEDLVREQKSNVN